MLKPSKGYNQGDLSVQTYAKETATEESVENTGVTGLLMSRERTERMFQMHNNVQNGQFLVLLFVLGFTQAEKPWDPAWGQVHFSFFIIFNIIKYLT